MSGEYDTGGLESADNFGLGSDQSNEWSKAGDLWSGYDQSGLSTLPDVSSPQSSQSSSGFDFSTPSDKPDNSGQYPILPIQTPWGTPKSDYNYWRPGQALDTLSAWGKTLPFGIGNKVQDAGSLFSQIGTNIANSDFGRTISTSPLATLGTAAGDTITGAIKGGFQTAGDFLSPLGESVSSLMKGDWGGSALNALRIMDGPIPGAGGYFDANQARVQGALHGDIDMQKQLGDELSFLGFLLPAAKGMDVLRAVAPGAADALGNAASSGIAKETIHWATRAMAAGYGAEIGGDIASGIDPRTAALNKIISEQRLVSEDSPFRGAYDFMAAGLVDPIPLLGKMADFGPVRHMMGDGGSLRLPWQGEMHYKGELTDAELAMRKSEAIMNLAERRVERRLDPNETGPIVVSKGSVLDEARSIDEALKSGSNGEYARTLSAVNEELDRGVRAVKEARYPDREPTAKELAADARQWDTTRNMIQTAEEQVAGHPIPEGPQEHLAIHHDGLTTLDYDRAIAAVTALAGSARANLSAFLDQLKQDHPGAFEDMNFKQKGKILEELAARRGLAPYEPTNGVIESTGQTNLERMLANGKDNGKLSIAERRADQAAADNGLRSPSGNVALSKNPMADVAAKVRAMGQHKVIVKGGNHLALDAETTVPRGHPAWHDLSRLAGGSGKLDNLLHENGLDRSTATLGKMTELLGKDNPVGAASLDRFTQPGRGYYTETSRAGEARVVRPVLWSDPTIAEGLKGSSTHLGKFVAGFRQYLPSAQLGRDMYDSQFAAWNKATGASRAEFEKLWDAFGQTAKDKGLTHMEQIQGNPPNISTELNSIAQKVLGTKADGINAAQVLAQGMPRDSLKQMIGQMTGQSVGRVGAGPSVFTALRSAGGGQAGDFWRWMATTGHPLVRYTLSPVWNGFVRLESKVFNFMNGAAFAPRDGILRDTVNAYMKPLMEKYAGKGAGLGNEAVPSEAMGSEAATGKPWGDKRTTLIERRMSYMTDQATVELPKEYARQLQAKLPQVWADVRNTVGSDRAAVEQFLTDQKVRRDFMSGNMSSEDMAKYAGLTTPESIALYMPLARRLEDSMQKVYLDAQTTHISNPMRSYWEKSLNHPALVYPLSWSMKALGEWAKFLTHSAFGLPTHMAGLVAYNDVMDATQKVIANDPDTQRFMKQHPETLKVLAYLMPGTPMTGVGMGVGGNLKTLYNVGHAISKGQNPVDQVRWGLTRDANALTKAWSEWILHKPETSLDKPGI